MRQIYRFDGVEPPQLSGKSLRDETERRKVRWQTIILAVAGLLTELCLCLTAVATWHDYPVFSIFCAAYAGTALCGSGVIAMFFTHKRRLFLCSLNQS